MIFFSECGYDYTSPNRYTTQVGTLLSASLAINSSSITRMTTDLPSTKLTSHFASLANASLPLNIAINTSTVRVKVMKSTKAVKSKKGDQNGQCFFKIKNIVIFRF
jgi:hypothetical protein